MKDTKYRLKELGYDENVLTECDLVIKALQRLESIDNSNPSEALECVDKILGYFGKAQIETMTLSKCDVLTIKQALLKAQKERKALDLLMQELDCKDFADLRKYARCGYQFRNAKGANYDNIIIDEAQEPKQYLKWEDLEFKEKTQKMKVKMGNNLYRIAWYNDGSGANIVFIYKYVTNDYLEYCTFITDYNQQFFNDLHLEVVEE